MSGRPALAATIVGLVLTLASGARGDGHEMKPAAKPDPDAAPCSAEGYRQFDFWIGDWIVETPEGEPAGANRIEAVLGGCALVEHWRGTTGSIGTSLNQYDARDGRWHQVWVDGRGGRLELTGRRSGDSMVLSGRTTSETGRVHHEISWTPLEDGRVRQHWRASKDGGASWEDVFVGIYRPR